MKILYNYRSFEFRMIVVIAITISLLFLPQFIHLDRINVLAYPQYDSLISSGQKNPIIAQGLTSTVGPISCTHPQNQQQSILRINTVVQDTGHFIKVPVNTLSFGVIIQNNGVSGTFRLGLANPLTICLNPGHFTVTETSFPSEFVFGPIIYSQSGDAINTSTNTPCSADITTSKSLTCTLTNTVTGITTPVNVTNITNITSLSVFGLASTNIKPDSVTLSLGVETTNKTASGAILANSKLMNMVLHALKVTGVKDNETSTSSFNISPNYSQTPGTRGSISGFTATNLITLHSSNTTGVSTWIDASIKAGANSVNGINFRLSDKKLSETRNTLTNNAIDDAQKKANSTASKLGLRVLGIKSIIVDGFEPLASSAQTIEAQGLPTGGSNSGSVNSPIISGEQQIVEKVALTFVLGK